MPTYDPAMEEVKRVKKSPRDRIFGALVTFDVGIDPQSHLRFVAAMKTIDNAVKDIQKGVPYEVSPEPIKQEEKH